MKKTNNTPIVRELIRLGMSRQLAYRVVNGNSGKTSEILVRLVRYLLDKGIKIE